MKRITLAAATALLLAGPLTATASAQSYERGADRGERSDTRAGRDNDRRDNSGLNGGRNDERGRADNDRRNNRDHDRRSDRGDQRHARWDGDRNNGYSYNGRWYYGPPQAAHQGRGYQAGYRDWRRGDRLPSYYQSRYRQVDYRREHLRAPPRGYHYVEDDRGEMLLVGIATGVILSVILSQ
ncbi:MAG TPA: RcnB family protein [Verrucomicrobiae bacterium]|nr:RcnB family protein [Verrucomicrobiae bacterium]